MGHICSQRNLKWRWGKGQDYIKKSVLCDLALFSSYAMWPIHLRSVNVAKLLQYI